MSKKTDIDWESVEMQYRAGIRSLKNIGKEFDVSDAGIIKRAKRDGWTRDLSDRIKVKAAAKVSASVVSAEVSARRTQTEKDIVEANATVIAQRVMEHRADITAYRSLCMKFLSEIEATTDNADLFEELGEMLRSEDKNGVDKRNDIYSKVISMPGRVDSFKKLAETLKTLIALEREAFNIDGARDTGGEGANNGGNNTTIINIGLPATSGFFGRITATGGGRTLPQSVQDRPLLPAAVRT